MLENKFLFSHVYELIVRAACILPENITAALESACDKEVDPLPRIHMQTALHHLRASREQMIPLCADTGFPVFYARLGPEIFVRGGIPALNEVISAAVQKTTEDGMIRPAVINPFTRENPGTNVGPSMPLIVYKFCPDIVFLELTAAPKGGGTEVFGPAFQALLHADGIAGIKKFVIDNVVVHGNKTGGTCPPNIVGVGVGGTSDLAMKLAKEAAVLRKIGERHPEKKLGELECELHEALNMSNIGPLGMGGKNHRLGCAH